MRNQSDTLLLVLFLSEEKMLQLSPNGVAKSKTGWQSQTWLLEEAACSALSGSNGNSLLFIIIYNNSNYNMLKQLRCQGRGGQDDIMIEKI